MTVRQISGDTANNAHWDLDNFYLMRMWKTLYFLTRASLSQAARVSRKAMVCRADASFIGSPTNLVRAKIWLGIPWDTLLVLLQL